MPTLFTKNNCQGCRATKMYLDNSGIEYEIRNVEEDETALADAMATGYMQLPIVVTDTEAWSGFRPDKLLTLAK